MIPIHVPMAVSSGPRRLKQRREAITALCSALEKFLALDVDAELEWNEKHGGVESRKPYVTPEMLVEAQAALERMEAQQESIQEMSRNFPEELAPMFASIESMFGQSAAVENQRAYVKMLQDDLDGKHSSVACECGASLMEDGSANRGFVRPQDIFRGTREECDEKARASGWAVNVDDNEHTCPECAA